MPLLFGCIIGFFVFTHIWAFIGPIVALLNFLIGRFFIASVIMAISLYSATFVWDDLHVGLEEYKALLILGLILEGIKWAIKLWWNRRQPKLDTTQAELGSDSKDEVWDIVINIVDDEPVKRPRKRTKKIELHKNARGVYVPDGS
jgi:hypothetical protein